MIILPLGHDKEIFHFPYVTVSIIVICLGVQIYSCATPSDKKRQTELLQEERQLRMKIWLKHSSKWIKDNRPDTGKQRDPKSMRDLLSMMKEMKQVRDKFFKDYEARRITGPSDPDLLTLRKLVREREEIRGVFSLGYQPKAGLKRWWTLITYAFVHGGWFHLIGNMLFLYLCGCNMEDRWGRGVWLAVYLLGGVVAALVFGALHSRSPVPLVGASGAIAAAMGAFLVVNYNTQIRMFYFFWFVFYPVRGTFYMRAFWALPLWLLQQVLGMMTESKMTPVAYSAHVAGFAAGVAVALVIKLLGWDLRLKTQSEAKATIYKQDPLFVAALEQLQQQDPVAAEASLEQLLAEQPQHLDALLELYRIKQDPGESARVAGLAIEAAKRARDRTTPCNVYRELKLREDVVLDDRSLLYVAQCFQQEEPLTAARAYRDLLELHPRSALQPKAMLDLARLYLGQMNEQARARELLVQVAQQHDGTAFAHQARELLAQTGPPADDQ